MKKFAISGQNPHIGTDTEIRYWYPLDRGKVVPVSIKVVPVPIHQKGIGTGTEQESTGTEASNNPIFVPLTMLSLVFVHRLFRDPNKGLMAF